MSQETILNFYQNRKKNIVEEVFNDEVNKINENCGKGQSEIEIRNSNQNCCEHIVEIERMKQVEIDLRKNVVLSENKAKLFEEENKKTKEKYDKLKQKHIQLLQVLLEKENAIQKLAMKIGRSDIDDQIADNIGLNFQEVKNSNSLN